MRNGLIRLGIRARHDVTIRVTYRQEHQQRCADYSSWEEFAASWRGDRINSEGEWGTDEDRVGRRNVEDADKERGIGCDDLTLRAATLRSAFLVGVGSQTSSRRHRRRSWRKRKGTVEQAHKGKARTRQKQGKGRREKTRDSKEAERKKWLTQRASRSVLYVRYVR